MQSVLHRVVRVPSKSRALGGAKAPKGPSLSSRSPAGAELRRAVRTIDANPNGVDPADAELLTACPFGAIPGSQNHPLA